MDRTIDLLLRNLRSEITRLDRERVSAEAHVKILNRQVQELEKDKSIKEMLNDA